MPSPTTKMIPVRDLSVDRSVQRERVDSARVDRMCREWMPDAVGVLVVSHRQDGSLHVIDGAHRRECHIQREEVDHEVNCLVYEGLDRATEAAMFNHLNDRRGINKIDDFRVRVVAQDPTAVALFNILTEQGWALGQGKNDRTFAAVSALEKIYSGAGILPKVDGGYPAATALTMRILTSAFGYDANGVRSELVHGVGLCVLRYRDALDIPKLISEMSVASGGARGLVGRAKGLRELRTGRVTDAMAEVLVGLHNRGKRNRLAQWEA